MSSERQTIIFLAQVMDQTERHQDMVEAMKRVIDLGSD
jgi:hypothetical protein